MKNILVKILLILAALLSIVAIILTAQLVYFEYLQELYFIFEGITLVTAIIAYAALEKIEKAKPQEVVKVIYKTAEKDVAKEKKTKEDTVKKEKELIDKIVSLSVKNLDKYTDSVEDFSDQLFKNLANSLNIVTGMLFLWDDAKQVYYTAGSYAFYREDTYKEYKLGEGLIGQVAKDRKILYIDNVPEGYIITLSGLGKGTPKYLAIIPIVKNKQTIGVVEIATFTPIPEPATRILETISQKLSEIDLEFE